MESEKIVLPGQPLSPDNGASGQCKGGSGTFTRDGRVFSSLFGRARKIVLPGQPLSPDNGASGQCKGGSGTFTRDGRVFSSLFGRARKVGETVTVMTPRTTLSVSAIPTPGSLITGQVTRLSRRDATLLILTIDGIPVPIGSEFIGVIRINDVRETEKDKIKIWNCFRGGDTVRARVVSRCSHFRLETQGNYFLSTAEDALGVISAISPGEGS
ncbi:hypothetical protein BT69DRAFT_94279 [Atractiella rhizophila]|nr:hypothetical protein BT69DRAFT_94279 [Atractiella rhizophila]